MACRLRIPTEFIQQQKAAAGDDDRAAARAAAKAAARAETADEDDELLSALASPAGSTSAARPLARGGRRRTGGGGALDEMDYLMGPQKSVHRRRADPRVSLSSILLDVFNELKTIAGVEHLWQPVNAKFVPDYYDIISAPMDLQQIRNRVNDNKYELRSQFMSDLKLIHENSLKYNGPIDPITRAAKEVSGRRVSTAPSMALIARARACSLSTPQSTT